MNPASTKKTGHLILAHDFGKCWPMFKFTLGLRSDCVTKWSLKIPPHLNRVATLPCVTQPSRSSPTFTNTCYIQREQRLSERRQFSNHGPPWAGVCSKFNQLAAVLYAADPKNVTKIFQLTDTIQCFDTVGWLGDRKGIRPVKSWVLVCWFVGGDDLTGALHSSCQ